MKNTICQPFRTQETDTAAVGPAIFWQCGTYCLNMVISEKFS
jgi:hypothetical protein